MAIVAVGISYKTAPIELRERVAFAPAEMESALEALRGEGVRYGVILSTCNRTEIYGTAADANKGLEAIQGFLASFHGVDAVELQPHLMTYADGEAVSHLLRVICSLDSMILGEAQILGQVRNAFAVATRHGMTGPTLSRLFHEAFRVGKAVRNETAIGRNALSVSRTAVQLARRTVSDLQSACVLVLGAGEAGKLAARALADAGAGRLVVANRTYARAAELAQELGGTPASLAQLDSLLEEADVVICATGSPGFVITPEFAAKARVTNSRPLVLIDIAMPRDVAPEVKGMPGVFLYDIDDLELVAESNRRQRQSEAQRAEAMVDTNTERFTEWLRSQDAVPTVAAIQERAEGIRSQELTRLLKLTPGLTPQEQEHLEAFSRAMLKKLLHPALTSVKEHKDPAFTQAARTIFGLGTQPTTER